MNKRAWRLAFWTALVIAGSVLAAWSQTAPAPATPLVHVISIDGVINPGSADHIFTAIDRATKDGAAALVIELDTPGGMYDTTRDIVQKMLAARVPILVYVTPSGARAGSAGVMVTLAAHVAAMAPSTSIGAASPVALDGEMDQTMKAKAFNDAMAFVEGIAQARGRNVEWSKKAVSEAAAVTATEAQRIKVIDIIADSLEDLLAKADGRKVVLGDKSEVVLRLAGARVEHIEMSLKDKIIFWLADPNLIYFFMMIGMLGIYTEFSHPGLIFPGVIGGICIVLFLVSTQILPINTFGLVLIALGMVLFVLEFKFTSYGALTAGGIILMILGSLFLFENPDKMIPNAGFRLRVSWGMILPSVLALGGFTLFVAYKVLRAQIRKGLTGEEGIMGETGLAATDVHAGGKVKVQGIYWEATADQPIAAGTRVRVVAASGIRLKVERITETKA